MILKPFEPRDADVAELKRLAALPQITAKTRSDITSEIAKIKSGDAAEKETAYEIDFGAGEGDLHFALHGLRLEHKGRVAQIDHLVLNRVLHARVYESKSFAGGVAINDAGEFTAFFNGKPQAMPSPIAQNEKHIDVLRSMYDDDVFQAPRRLGFKMQLDFKSMIVVSSKSRITRPSIPIPGLDRLVKSDQLRQLHERDGQKALKNPVTYGRICSAETVLKLAQSILAQHKPLTVDWAGRFGIDTSLPPVQPATTVTGSGAYDAPFCALCDNEVDANVVAWCKRNKAKFDGQILCRPHQKLYEKH